MKKLLDQWRSGRPLLKFDLKMKLTTLLVITTLFGMHANDSYAQKTKVSLNVENVTVLDIFDDIESATDFRFIYKTRHVDLQRRLSLKVNKEHIETVLKRLFDDTNTVYRVRGTHITLRKSNKKSDLVYVAPPETTTGQPQDHTITGTITDENGTPLVGANILEKGTLNGTQTDFDGNFTITVSDENATLVVSYLGFTTREIAVGGQTELTITLAESAAGLEEVVVVGYGT
ncbi:MAG: carboxypeptidase-like regulatory domain-containing protein, partial [Aurantibacter sp.]